MIKRNVMNYYEHEADRREEGTVFIIDDVSEAEWAKIPQLCRDFFQHFDTSLLILPIPGAGRLEIWFKALSGVSFTKADKFISDWFFPPTE